MEKEYYVYFHVCPLTGQTVYIGHGKIDRAWTCRKPNRQPEHVAWLKSLFKLGYTLIDIVRIQETSLTKDESKVLEKKHILEIKPLFNRAKGLNSYVPVNKLELAKELRNQGKTFKEIGEVMQQSTMSAYRWCQ